MGNLFKAVSWPFKKKTEQPEKEYKRFTISGDEALELKRLFDKIGDPKHYHATRYLFWTRVAELFPETLVGSWRCYNTTYQVIITNKPKKD